MATEADKNSADDREVIRLAKSRLMRVCRWDGALAERSLMQAAKEQRAALVSVAMRVLAASSQDLAAGRVLRADRPPGQSHQASRPKRQKPPHNRAHGRPRRRRK